MKKLYSKLLSKLDLSPSKKDDELCEDTASVIVKCLIDNLVTENQQTITLFRVVEKLQAIRANQIDDAKKRLQLLEEDYSILIQ